MMLNGYDEKKVKLIETAVAGTLSAPGNDDAESGGAKEDDKAQAEVVVDTHVKNDLLLLSFRVDLFADAVMSAENLIKKKNVKNILIDVYCPTESDDVDINAKALKWLFDAGKDYNAQFIDGDFIGAAVDDWDAEAKWYVLDPEDTLRFMKQVASDCKAKKRLHGNVHSVIWFTNETRFASNAADGDRR
jgi:hypothetical protein